MRLMLPALLLAVLLAGAPALADVVHLRTGEAVKGRPIQEQSNESELTIEDYVTGAVRRFSWDAVDPRDRDRLQEQWGIKSTAQFTVNGHRLVQRLTGNQTEEILGLIEREDANFYYVRQRGELLPVPRGQVVGIEEEELDAREVYSPEQIYQRKLSEILQEAGITEEELTSRQHWALADVAEWADALEQAAHHYRLAADDVDFLNREVAAQRLARVEGLLRDKAALDTLREARRQMNLKRFKHARDILDGFGEKHPEASEAVTDRLERLRGDFVQRRTAEMQKVAGRRFVKIVEDLIEEKVREEDIKITDATAWTRRELPDAAFAILAEDHMGRYDDVTPDEARTFWEGRPRRNWQEVDYGAGTFIVEPPKVRAPRRRTSGGGSSGGGAAPRIEIPKPPTRDGWWDKAGTKERAKWVLAFFVEQSELFEMGDRGVRNCPLCHAEGLIHRRLQTGDTLSYLCPRCGGAQQDIVVKFR